jgi:hypothetical protein
VCTTFRQKILKHLDHVQKDRARIVDQPVDSKSEGRPFSMDRATFMAQLAAQLLEELQFAGAPDLLHAKVDALIVGRVALHRARLAVSGIIADQPVR